MEEEYNLDYDNKRFEVIYTANSAGDALKLVMLEDEIKRHDNPNLKVAGSRQEHPNYKKGYLILSMSRELADKINLPQLRGPNVPSRQ